MSRFQRLTDTMRIRQPYGVTVHIGEIAISKNGNPYPKAIDHFRFDGMFAERCQNHYSGKPTVLHICFPKADPEQTCLITQEGAFNGAPLTRSYFEWSKGGGERYEIFDYKTQQWKITNEDELTAAEQSYLDYAQKTPKTTFAITYNMRLSFWLVELMAEGVDCLCQLNTKADDSSIPAILHVLQDAQNANRLQMYPYELSVEMVEGKGMNPDGEMKKKEYPVLRLGLMGSPEDLQRQQQAIDSYLQIRRILPFSEQLQQSLAAANAPQNALNAAPNTIDAEHAVIDATPEPPIDAVTAEGDALVASWTDPLSDSQQKAKAYWQQYRTQIDSPQKEKVVARMRELTPPAEPQAKPMREPGEEG